MLGLVVTLLIIALIAGILGFGGIAGAAVGFAKIIFLVSLVLLLVSLLFGGLRGGFGRPLDLKEGKGGGKEMKKAVEAKIPEAPRRGFPAPISSPQSLRRSEPPPSRQEIVVFRWPEGGCRTNCL